MPHGSSGFSGPVELSIGGPFAGSGPYVKPRFDFTIAFSAQGSHGSLEVISSGRAGYITVDGHSYRTPASTFRNLESGLGLLAGYSGAKPGPASPAGSAPPAGARSASGMSTLARLGIRPLDWLVHPRILGPQTIAGVATTRIHAGVDAAALVHDLSLLLTRADALTARAVGERALPRRISRSAQRSLARALGSPSLDVWTGATDRVVRRLRLSASVPVRGRTRALFGGLRSVDVSFGFDYSGLNQPQTITIPAVLRPYRVFHRLVDRLIAEIEKGVSVAPLGP